VTTENPVREQVALLTDLNLEAGRADALAVIDPAGVEHTFGDVHRGASRFADRLLSLGVGREQRVVLVMDDSLRFHAAFLGSIRAGAVPVPVNFLARSDDFRYFLEDSYAVAVVVDAPFLDAVEPHAKELDVALITGGVPDVDQSVEAWTADGVDDFDAAPAHADDAAFWLYSSGSTGRPKGVVHTHKDVVFTCERYAGGVLGIQASDRVFSTTKLFHAYGLGNGLTFPLYHGATAVQLGGRPTPEAVLTRVVETRPSILFSVPALYNAMLNSEQIDDVDLSSLRLGVSAAEALPPEVWRRWHERTGTEILDGIGSTEMLHIYCSNRASAVVPGTSGTPVDGYELQLRDPETGEILTGAKAEGTLWVKGDSALAYYWHNSAKTRACLQGDWFFSGDRYRRNTDGTYAYEGRADDMIKVKGLWVSPIEIENRLIEHPAVTEAAVVGATREGMTSIVAHVIPAAGHESGDELTSELQEWCKEALLRYQYPHEVVYVDDFPRTPTGKVQRFKLREESASG